MAMLSVGAVSKVQEYVLVICVGSWTAYTAFLSFRIQGVRIVGHGGMESIIESTI